MSYLVNMQAMMLDAAHVPLREAEVPRPEPGPGQVLLRVCACAVCRTDLHVFDGELSKPKLPLIPGHEIVGRVVENGRNAGRYRTETRVGVPWLGWTCGECKFCLSGRENLCLRAEFTGYTLDGGYAGYVVADERFCFAIPERYSDAQAAPLLCAGLIGYRSLTKAGDAKRVGIYGFGSAAHIVCQIAVKQGREVYAFTRPGDDKGQALARSLGVVWAGDSETMPPEPLDAAMIFAPVGALVPQALKAVDRGGTVVCGGIHMSEIPAFSYDLLWQERTIRSVANLTRRDGEEFMAVVERIPVDVPTETFPLSQANDALERLRSGKLNGTAVLIPS
jgi:propanol-preferring alcohol dehydrogenase